MAENTEGKKISELGFYSGGFAKAATGQAVFPVAEGAGNFKLKVSEIQTAIENLIRSSLTGTVTQTQLDELRQALEIRIQSIVSEGGNAPGVAEINRAITVDDNSSATSVQDVGGNITVPLAVTVPAASASNTQNTVTTAQPLRTFLKSVRDNIAHLFSNKQDKLIAGTNITIDGNTISASGGSNAPTNASLTAESGTGTDTTTPAVASATIANVLQTIWAKIRQVVNVLGTKVTANAVITAATKTKITYDEKGLVASGADLAESDIPSLSISKITNLQSTLNGKQAALTAGTNITISNNVISAAGGSGGGGNLTNTTLPISPSPTNTQTANDCWIIDFAYQDSNFANLSEDDWYRINATVNTTYKIEGLFRAQIVSSMPDTSAAGRVNATGFGRLFSNQSGTADNSIAITLVKISQSNRLALLIYRGSTTNLIALQTIAIKLWLLKGIKGDKGDPGGGDYLPLSGGTLTGDVYIKDDGNVARKVIEKNDASWCGKIKTDNPMIGCIMTRDDGTTLTRFAEGVPVELDNDGNIFSSLSLVPAMISTQLSLRIFKFINNDFNLARTYVLKLKGNTVLDFTIDIGLGSWLRNHAYAGFTFQVLYEESTVSSSMPVLTFRKHPDSRKVYCYKTAQNCGLNMVTFTFLGDWYGWPMFNADLTGANYSIGQT